MKFDRNSATPRPNEDGKLSVKTTRSTRVGGKPQKMIAADLSNTDLESNILPKIITTLIEIIPNKFGPYVPNYESF
jgi:hypothetical protein